MGIFNSNSGKKLDLSKGVTIISEYSRFKGDIETEATLQVEGIVEGNIKSLNAVNVGLKGNILGYIEANEVNVDGEMNGEIIADKVEIGPKGVVRANITSAILSIQEGGVFEGVKKIKNLSREVATEVE